MHTFNHIKINQLNFNLLSETSKDGFRIYHTPTGEIYPSVTTVLSSHNKKKIDEWRKRIGEIQADKISKKAARRGTILHNVCEEFLLNQLSADQLKRMMPTTKQLFFQIYNELIKNLNNIYCIEQSLYSHRLKIAGKVDCIGEWNKNISVIDFKTSTRLKLKENIDNYFMQCSAYAEMFGEITNRHIEDIVIIIAVEEETKPQIFIEKKQKYLSGLNFYIDKFHEKIKEHI